MKNLIKNQTILFLLSGIVIFNVNCSEDGGQIEDTTSTTPAPNYKFTMTQTLSSGAQINTIAFSGLAFYTGSFYASSFYPPGKVADYFGFQFMRDNDPTESGHNTDYLTKAAWHTMNILTSAQLQKLIDLSAEQAQLFNDYALGRLVLIKAFHRYLDGNLPAGTTTLDADKVKAESKKIYLIDGEITYRRAIVFSEIINSLSASQKSSLDYFSNTGMQQWSMPSKPTATIPQGLNVWVMSNASEMFSWYLRDIQADIYFCPERQGTYFGGFFMKDAPAVGNPGYAIDPQATANKGNYFLNTILTAAQSAQIKSIYTNVQTSLTKIVDARTKIATELRKGRAGSAVDKNTILNLSANYGEADGDYIYQMVDKFVAVSKTLTAHQKTDLIKLRDLANYPDKPGKVFIYSAEMDTPALPNTDYLFK